MKKTIGILLSLVLVLICAFALADVEINETNFPDEIFRNTITAAFDADGDGSLSDAEIAGITDLGCAESGIESLKGVEYFTALRVLDCHKNKLTGLDVTQNTALEELYCCEMELKTLDVSRNTALKVLDCWACGLTALNVGSNTALMHLDCQQNQLAALDVSSNTALIYLDCQKNQLASLDVSKNTALTYLDCQKNQLTALDVSSNTALTVLVCHSNSLKALDVSKNTALDILHCHYNDIQKINVIQVPALAGLLKESIPAVYDGLLDWQKDDNGDGAPDRQLIVDEKVRVIANHVGLNETNFPDAAFRNAAAALDADGDGYLDDEEIAEATDLGCSESGIESLKGIEYFTALRILDCHKNKLTSLDVSKNTALEELYCCETELKTLDVSRNTALTVLDCWDCGLTALNVESNTMLQRLDCQQNQLTALDVSKNTALTYLDCQKNQLTALDVSKNTALTYLDCQKNQLVALDVSKNTALTVLACHSNRLKALDVSKNTALAILHCHYNSIQKLDIMKVPALVSLMKESIPAEYDGLCDWQTDDDGDGVPDRQLIVDEKTEVISEQIDISKAKVTAIKAQVYTGKALKPAVTVKYSGKKLVKDKDYTVAYKNNKKIGTATVTITGKGNYTGKTTVTFDIIPKGVKIASLTPGKKELTVKWAKGSGITGYEIEYCLKKDFKGAKTVTVKQAATTKTVLKKLRAAKTYYVRIRTYKTVNGKKYYSAWSAVKSRKTK